MKRQKHRVVVEITLSEPVTEKFAAATVALMLDDADAHAFRVRRGVYVIARRTKEFGRVYRAAKRKGL
jgi:hypothetical protein